MAATKEKYGWKNPLLNCKKNGPYIDTLDKDFEQMCQNIDHHLWMRLEKKC